MFLVIIIPQKQTSGLSKSVYDYGEVDEYGPNLMIYDGEDGTTKRHEFNGCFNATLLDDGSIVWDKERYYGFSDARNEVYSTDIYYRSSNGKDKLIATDAHVVLCSTDSRYILAMKEVCNETFPIIIDLKSGKSIYYFIPEELYDNYFFL